MLKMRNNSGLLAGCLCGFALFGGPAVAADVSPRVAKLNEAFTRWLADQPSSLAQQHEIFVPPSNRAADARAEEWVFDALQVVRPEFCAALDAFDRGEYEAALTQLRALRVADNRFLAAHVAYFEARILVAQGLLEEAERHLQDRRVAFDEGLSVFAPHARFLLAHAQAANLRYEDARKSLAPLTAVAVDAPESVALGAKQLALELDRREEGTLGEAADLMQYAQRRLNATDATERVQQRQEEAMALLDKLIEEAKKQEQQQGGGGRSARGQRSAKPQGAKPTDESRTGRGAGEIGDLHTAPRANPGEMWGKLPPAERERILQKLRDRYPSRYRQIVEQYYRTLAEQP